MDINKVQFHIKRQYFFEFWETFTKKNETTLSVFTIY